MTPQLKAGIVIGGSVVGMFALLLIVALVTRTPMRSSMTRVDPQSRARQAAWAQDAKLKLIQNGTFTKIDCPNHEAKADGLAWSSVPLDSKKVAVEALSRICKAETTDERLALIDNRSGRPLAEYSIWSGVTLH